MLRRSDDMIHSHKLSTESENLTIPLREDTERRKTLGTRIRGVRAVRRRLHLCRPDMRGLGIRLQPVPETSPAVTLPAVWIVASDVSTGHSRVARAQLSDRERSHSADCGL